MNVACRMVNLLLYFYLVLVLLLLCRICLQLNDTCSQRKWRGKLKTSNANCVPLLIDEAIVNLHIERNVRRVQKIHLRKSLKRTQSQHIEKPTTTITNATNNNGVEKYANHQCKLNACSLTLSIFRIKFGGNGIPEQLNNMMFMLETLWMSGECG